MANIWRTWITGKNPVDLPCRRGRAQTLWERLASPRAGVRRAEPPRAAARLRTPGSGARVSGVVGVSLRSAWGCTITRAPGVKGGAAIGLPTPPGALDVRWSCDSPVLWPAGEIRPPRLPERNNARAPALGRVRPVRARFNRNITCQPGHWKRRLRRRNVCQRNHVPNAPIPTQRNQSLLSFHPCLLPRPTELNSFGSPHPLSPTSRAHEVCM